MNNFIYNTNTLLSLSRLPCHFWAILNPDKDPRDNPGISILSYIVAKTLRFETTVLPKELNENFKRLLDFSSQKEQICEALKLRIQTLATVLTNYNGHDKYWSIAINASLSLDKIKSKINEIIIKMTTADINDFTINDELIHVKTELDKLKMVLNDEGILFEWEENDKKNN